MADAARGSASYGIADHTISQGSSSTRSSSMFRPKSTKRVLISPTLEQHLIVESSAWLPARALQSPIEHTTWLDQQQPAFPAMFVRPPCCVIFAVLLIAAGLTCSCVFREALARALHTSVHADELCVEILSAASIPLVSICFTYVHIWLALFMTFFPTRFVGCWQVPYTNIGFPFGWQGIVPWKGREMAMRACKLMTAHLFRVDELLLRLKPEALAAALGDTVDRIVAAAVEAAAHEIAPRAWARVPESYKDTLRASAKATAPTVLQGILDDIRSDSKEGRGFRLERLVDHACRSSPKLMSAMFIRTGWKELVFIRNFGATMGGVLGVIQMSIWFVYRGSWLLPVFGLAAGALTNWVALAMIFYPRKPERVQGSGAYEAAIERACAVVCDRLPDAIKRSDEYVREALRLEETVRERMAALPGEEFEPLLHSVFKEDEWKLFVVGGALGAAIGVAQQYTFTALGLS